MFHVEHENVGLEKFMDQERKCYLLKKAFGEIGLELTEQQYRQFLQYYEILIEKNKVMNLTGITDFEEVIHKHFVDSVINFEKMVDKKKNMRLIDMGTGAGFPGIPIKIVYPSVNVVLLDSLNKRVKFLQEVIEMLELENITAIHSRAEDAGRNVEYREQFDCCVSRAVANLATLSEYCLPFVKTGGYFVAYKAGGVEEELEKSKRAIGLLGAVVEEEKKFLLPGTDISRTMIYIKKNKPIAKRYPRKAGLPSKEPLS